jgi:hypothetical protein
MDMNPAVAFIHCNYCLQEVPKGVSANDWARLSVGVTPTADLVVWCVRHEIPVIIHKQGQIDSDLRDAVFSPCARCGKIHAETEKEGN